MRKMSETILHGQIPDLVPSDESSRPDEVDVSMNDPETGRSELKFVRMKG